MEAEAGELAQQIGALIAFLENHMVAHDHLQFQLQACMWCTDIITCRRNKHSSKNKNRKKKKNQGHGGRDLAEDLPAGADVVGTSGCGSTLCRRRCCLCVCMSIVMCVHACGSRGQP